MLTLLENQSIIIIKFSNCEILGGERIIKLENIRKEKRFTQQEMAEKLDIAISTYSQYETGSRGIPVHIAIKISEILDIEISKIFLPTKFTVSKSDELVKEKSYPKGS